MDLNIITSIIIGCAIEVNFFKQLSVVFLINLKNIV